jgi:ribosomal RNA-processing protein 7
VHDEQIPDVAELQEEIDKFMQQFDKQVEQEKQQLKEEEGVPDDEGWITVTKK